MFNFIKSMHLSSIPLINALLVTLIFFVIAFLSYLLIAKVLKKVTKFTKTEFDDRMIEAIQLPVFFTILFSGLLYALGSLIWNQNTKFYVECITYTLLAIIWMVAIIRITNALIEKVIYRLVDVSGLKKQVIPLIESLAKIGIIFTTFFIVLTIWQFDIKPLLASAGIVSIIVALAAKDSLSNFFAGVSVFLDKPYVIGDYIELDKGQRGEVIGIGMRSTKIKTRDDILISIPNSIIANAQIINESAPIKQFRVRVPFGVAYGTDIDLMEKVVLEIASKNENIILDPEPRLRLRSFGENSLEYELLCWALEPAQRGLTIHQLNSAIYKKFTELGIDIPVPRRVIYIKSTPGKEFPS